MNDKIPVIRFPPISNYYLGLSQFHDSIRTVKCNKSGEVQQIDIHPFSSKSKNVVTSMRIIVFYDAESQQEAVAITPYDTAVMDTMYTMYTNGISAFSPEMAVRLLYGNPSLQVTQLQKEALVNSVEKLSKILIEIDCTDELRKRHKLKEEESVVLRGQLLPAQAQKVRPANHNSTVMGYRLTETPILYQYANRIGQIACIPAELMRSNHTRNTSEVMLLRRYLLRRIAIMKNSHNKVKSTRIVLSRYDVKTNTVKGLLPCLGYHEEDYAKWRSKKSKIHRAIKTILDELVEIGFIQGYSIVQNGTVGKPYNIMGYDIILPLDS